MAHLRHDLLEAVEAAPLGIDVLLVDLIGEDEQSMLVGESNNVLDVRTSEHLPRGIARIDDHYGPDIIARAVLLEGALELFGAQRPVIVFVEVVSSLAEVELLDGRGVERVLGDGDHYAALLSALRATRDEQFEYVLN